VLLQAERLAASLWGADLCRFCLNGSTQGNQALTLAAARPGDRVVVTRSLHKSLFAGLVLADLEPVLGLAVEADLWAEGIRLELANRDTLIPLVTIADTEESVGRLVDALERSLARHRGARREIGAASAVWSIEPEVALRPRKAFFAALESVPVRGAAGRIAAETIAPYPPGIPAIAPGEVISGRLLGALREAAAAGTRLAYCADPSLATVQVVAR
jgi:arginine/lysine/ornithine decarboxylase